MPITGQVPLTRLQQAAGLAIIVIYLGFSIAMSLTARPQSDEAVYANPGYNLIHNGHMGTTLYELAGFLPFSTARHTYLQPPAYYVATAGLFTVAGFGVMQVRMFSIFFGLVCLLSWFAIVRGLLNAAAPALLVMGFISIDYFFLFGASHGRMDMMCVGVGSAALATYVNLRGTSLGKAIFWSNMLAALSLITHPAGLVWCAGVLLMMLLLDRKSLSIRHAVPLAIPYALAFLAWGVYIVQDWGGFKDQMKATLIINERSFDYSHLSHNRLLRYLQQEILTRYAAPFGFLHGVSLASRLKILILGAYLTGVSGILFVGRLRRQPALLWFSVVSLSAFSILAEVSPSKFAYYLPHTTVMMAACLGVFLYTCTPRPRWMLIGVVGILIAGIQLGGVAHLVRRDDFHRTYLPVIAAIKQNSPPNSLTMSEGELWFGLVPDRKVLLDPQLGFRSGLHPDIFVMNSVFRDLHERDRTENPAAYDHVQRLLDRSRLVYEDSYSRVYVTAGDGILSR